MEEKVESSVIELMAPIILSYCAVRETHLGVFSNDSFYNRQLLLNLPVATKQVTVLHKIIYLQTYFYILTSFLWK